MNHGLMEKLEGDFDLVFGKEGQLQVMNAMGMAQTQGAMDYMDRELGKIRMSWQDLANEIRNMVELKSGSIQHANAEELKKVKGLFKGVSSLMLMQQVKFQEVADSIPAAYDQVKEFLQEKYKIVTDQIQAAREETVKQMKISKKANKKMVVFVQGQVSKTVKKVTKNLRAMQDLLKPQFDSMNEMLSADQKRTQTAASSLRHLQELITKVEQDAVSAHKKVTNEAKNAYNTLNIKSERETEQLVHTAGNQLSAIMKTVKERGTKMGEELAKIEGEQKETTQKIVDNTDLEMKDVDKQFFTESEDTQRVIADAKKTVSTSTEKLQQFRDMSTARVEELKQEVEADKQEMHKVDKTQNNEWAQRTQQLEQEQEEAYHVIETDSHKLSDEQTAALESASDETKAAVAAVSAAADMGLGEMKKKLAAISAVEIESFDDSTAWMGDLDGLVNEFGGELTSWEEE